MNYAGFWRRLVAVFMDGIILRIGGSIVGYIVGLAFGTAGGSEQGAAIVAALISLIGGWLYYTLMESSAKQATLGKMAMEIYVTDLNGDRISFGRATGRYFGKILSSLIFFIGYIMAAFTEKKQALHDKLAGTLVVRSKQ